MYPVYFLDSVGNRRNASNQNYTFRFTPGQLPPVNSFGSLTSNSGGIK